jgi:hypothetical protein
MTRNHLNAQVACPPGTYATGGGADVQVNDPHRFLLRESQPLLDNDRPAGWRVDYGYDGALPAVFDVAVFAICTVE